MPFLLLYVVWIGGGHFSTGWRDALWLIGGSLFTGIPLILFAEATKQSRFAIVGFSLIRITVVLYCVELIRQDKVKRIAAIAA